MTRYDQHKKEEIVVESIKENSDEKQAELIADNFSEVSLEYDSLNTEDISIPKLVRMISHNFQLKMLRMLCKK